MEGEARKKMANEYVQFLNSALTVLEIWASRHASFSVRCSKHCIEGGHLATRGPRSMYLQAQTPVSEWDRPRKTSRTPIYNRDSLAVRRVSRHFSRLADKLALHSSSYPEISASRFFTRANKSRPVLSVGSKLMF